MSKIKTFIGLLVAGQIIAALPAPLMIFVIAFAMVTAVSYWIGAIEHEWVAEQIRRLSLYRLTPKAKRFVNQGQGRGVDGEVGRH